MRILVFCLIIVCVSCNLKEKEKQQTKIYFDLETYFKNEAKRLTKKQQPVDKTVTINGKTEQKKLIIKNWEKEFGTFINADINKASWRGSFELSNTAESKIYTSNNKKIPVKKLQVVEANGKVICIQLFIHNINDLYASEDSLSYYPDSLYRIKKTQKIKLLEEKHYEIVGKMK